MSQEVIGKRNRDRQPNKPQVVKAAAIDWDHKRVSTQRLIDVLLEQGVIDDDDEPTIESSPSYGEADGITVRLEDEGTVDIDIGTGTTTVMAA